MSLTAELPHLPQVTFFTENQPSCSTRTNQREEADKPSGTLARPVSPNHHGYNRTTPGKDFILSTDKLDKDVLVWAIYCQCDFTLRKLPQEEGVLLPPLLPPASCQPGDGQGLPARWAQHSQPVQTDSATNLWRAEWSHRKAPDPEVWQRGRCESTWQGQSARRCQFLVADRDYTRLATAGSQALGHAGSCGQSQKRGLHLPNRSRVPSAERPFFYPSGKFFGLLITHKYKKT